MLFVIVATGNHFWLDAVAGGAVVLVAWLLARTLIEPAPADQRTYAAAST
jgi:hypothetical protein